MKRWIKERWQCIAGIVAIVVLLVLLVTSVNLVIIEFSKNGGFHGLAVLIGKEVKEIAKEIDEN